jgi:hypothetical protein
VVFAKLTGNGVAHDGYAFAKVAAVKVYALDDLSCLEVYFFL